MSISRAARFGGISLAVALLGGGIAYAVSPHFTGTPTASLKAEADDPAALDLAVDFKEAGLGTNQLITYNVTTTVSGSCACVTNSGNCPAAANKFPPTTVVTPGTFN